MQRTPRRSKSRSSSIPIRTLADFKGLKLRTANRWVTKLLAILGATPVGMPVGQAPDALSKHVIDGAAMPWEIIPSLKVHELVKFHKEVGAKGWDGPALLKSAKQLVERFDPNWREVLFTY